MEPAQDLSAIQTKKKKCCHSKSGEGGKADPSAIKEAIEGWGRHELEMAEFHAKFTASFPSPSYTQP